MTTDWERLRGTFEVAAGRYDRARPGYPSELFDELSGLTGVVAGDRVLEIGCGTGIATPALATRGLRVTCVELGSALAAVARRNLADLPALEVHEGAFEDWRTPIGVRFDLVVAATAWHWMTRRCVARRPGDYCVRAAIWRTGLRHTCFRMTAIRSFAGFRRSTRRSVRLVPVMRNGRSPVRCPTSGPRSRPAACFESPQRPVHSVQARGSSPQPHQRCKGVQGRIGAGRPITVEVGVSRTVKPVERRRWILTSSHSRRAAGRARHQPLQAT